MWPTSLDRFIHPKLSFQIKYVIHLPRVESFGFHGWEEIITPRTYFIKFSHEQQLEFLFPSAGNMLTSYKASLMKENNLLKLCPLTLCLQIVGPDLEQEQEIILRCSLTCCPKPKATMQQLITIRKSNQTSGKNLQDVLFEAEYIYILIEREAIKILKSQDKLEDKLHQDVLCKHGDKMLFDELINQCIMECFSSPASDQSMIKHFLHIFPCP